jgi:hypothetical protein
MNSIIQAVDADDDALTQLLRLGHAHLIEVQVTHTAEQEAMDDPDAKRRAKRYRQVRGFPTVMSAPSNAVKELAAEENRAAGIGQHLLYHELRSCAADGTRKLFVTVSSGKPK